jgi:GT2 family glycosyltransferase
MSARVLVSIVAYNSARHLKACLEALAAQTYRNFEIAFWDNASTDDTAAIIGGYRQMIALVRFSERNLGFCTGHNALIQTATSDYILTLNPDVTLDPAFLQNLVRGMDADPSAGSASGKLLRQTPSASPARAATGENIIDSTGIYFTPNQRHFDRGSGELDIGQFEKTEYVFGPSGAAALYRRAMLNDIQFGGEFFDESFFAYREDADLAWRAQWMGWRCLYVPAAIAFHERQALPANRSTLADAINMHSFKNRFLLRVKNMDPGTCARFLIPIAMRDLAAIGYVVLREWSSLPGIPRFLRALPRTWNWRKFIRSRRRISPREIRSWFSNMPVSKPVGNEKS